MNRDLLRVALALITWGLGEGMFFFFQPLYLQELGADPLTIGSIMGVVGVAMMLSYVPAGLLSDWLGRRPIIISAWIVASCGTLLMAFAPSLPLFAAGMVLYGLTAYVTVPLNSYVTAARGRLSVGRALTLMSASFSGGAVLGPLLGGWVAEQSGLQMNFRLAMFTFALSTMIIFTIRPQPVEGQAKESRQHLRVALMNGRYLRYVGLMFLVIFSLYLPQPLTQNFLQNERGVPFFVLGQLISARSVGVVVLNLLLGHFSPRFSLVAAQLGMALFNLLIWQGNGFPFYLAAYFLLGSFLTTRNLVIAQSRTLVHAAQMGTAYGLLEAVMSLAYVLAPPLAGLLYEWQPEAVYPLSFGLTILGVLAYIIFSPVRQVDLLAFEEQETLKTEKEEAEWARS